MTSTASTADSKTPKYKFVFVGDQSVGKTSIITRFVEDTFEGGYEATIGVDFLTKTVYKDDTRVKLHLWDTAGQERFKSLIPSYIRRSHCVCFIYDITAPETLHNVRYWCQKAEEYCGNFESVQSVLIGNKTDLQHRRKVSSYDATQLAEELGIKHTAEVSAKTGDNVDAVFEQMITRLPMIRMRVATRLNDAVQLDNDHKKSGCCSII